MFGGATGMTNGNPTEVENMVVEAADMMKENAARLTFPAARLWVKSEFREVPWTLDLLSNEKNTCCYVGWNVTTQLCEDYFVDHDIRIPIKQPEFNGK